MFLEEEKLIEQPTQFEIAKMCEYLNMIRDRLDGLEPQVLDPERYAKVTKAVNDDDIGILLALPPMGRVEGGMGDKRAKQGLGGAGGGGAYANQRNAYCFIIVLDLFYFHLFVDTKTCFLPKMLNFVLFSTYAIFRLAKTFGTN